MLKKEHYFPIFSLVVAIAALVFAVYSGQQQREFYAQVKELNAETAEILKNRALLASKVDLPTPSSAALAKWVSGIEETHVRKTTCSAAAGQCITQWVPKSEATNNPSGGASCFDTTIRDPLKNSGREYVVKTTCQTY